MPIATIKTMKGALSQQDKLELHKRFADLMVEIEGKGNEEIRKFVILAIEEEDPINMGIAGVAATEETVQRLTKAKVN